MKKSNRNIKQDFIYLKEDRYKKPKEVHKKYVDLLKKEKITSNTSLLDVGCAGGELIFNIKKKFPKINITGIDIHQPLLDKAKRKTFKDIVYKKKDISRKNLKLGKYDIITMSGLLGFFKNPENIFDNLIKNLNYGGKIFIYDLFNPHPYNVYIKYENCRDKKNVMLDWYNKFSLYYLKKILKKKNMKVKIIPFKLKKKLKKRKNLIRAWTVGSNNTKYTTNDLCEIYYEYFIKIYK